MGVKSLIFIEIKEEVLRSSLWGFETREFLRSSPRARQVISASGFKCLQPNPFCGFELHRKLANLGQDYSLHSRSIPAQVTMLNISCTIREINLSSSECEDLPLA